MPGRDTDDLTQMLNDGWQIVGYSVCLLAMGAHSHNILLQKEMKLVSTTIITQSESETGRIVNVLAPMPEKKKGFFG